MISLKQPVSFYQAIVTQFQTLAIPALLLFTRLWVAWVFFNAGLVKIATWDSTLYLFEFEYQVPLIPWQLAAYLATATELILPGLLALGVITRPVSAILFVFNIIAVVSYPTLWAGGFYDHQLWGLMLLVNTVWGAGGLSVDKYLKHRLT
jgi:putative oxidoreductase